MAIDVYADVVFFINFIMDFFILWLAGKASKKNIVLPRLVLGALVMSLLYCLVVFFSTFRIYYNIFASFLLIMIGTFISYKIRGLSDFIKTIALAYAASFTIGGIGIALYYFTDIPSAISSMSGFDVKNISVKLLVASSCGFYIIFKLISRAVDRMNIKKQAFLNISIFLDGKRACVTALVDTGNSLRDPLTDAPVIIAEFDSIKDFFPDSVRLMFYEKNEDDMGLFLKNVKDSVLSMRVRLIPFSSIGRCNGMLVGFRPDKVELDDGSGNITLTDVTIGIYNFKLSADDRYQGLLSPELLQSIGLNKTGNSTAVG